LSENTPIAHFEGMLKTKNPRPATLVIRDSDVLREGSTEYSPRTLSVEIENTGDATAFGVKVDFQLATGVQAIGKTTIVIQEIPPNTTSIARMRMQKTVQFEASETEVQYLIQDATSNRTRGAIAVSFDEIIQGQGEQFVLFTQPNEARVNIKQLDWDLPAFPIEATFGTATELQAESTMVLMNNRPVDKGKMDEEDLSPPAKSGGLNYYAYENVVQLNEGLNRIRVQMRTPKGIVQSNEIVVNYVPRKPNLHVLAIGVPHKDLKYTSKDAQDFATQFRGQAGEGRAYNRVFINQLTAAQETQFIPVRAAFTDLKSRFESEIKENRITREDVLMVFISSHGKSEQDEFKILTSEYEQFPTAALLDYRRDVLEVLTQIDCKKFVFIDACHSGGAEGGKEGLNKSARKALELINATYPGLNVLTSSQIDQLSYEDDAWENGAFTESILDAFQNRMVADAKGNYFADGNQDRVIDFGELYEFLKRRVPSLVLEKKQKPQMPSRTTNTLGDAIPIFIQY
ncbi:MAG: caspase family protein, partial [Bacteroidota bacterium]